MSHKCPTTVQYEDLRPPHVVLMFIVCLPYVYFVLTVGLRLPYVDRMCSLWWPSVYLMCTLCIPNVYFICSVSSSYVHPELTIRMGHLFLSDTIRVLSMIGLEFAASIRNVWKIFAESLHQKPLLFRLLTTPTTISTTGPSRKQLRYTSWVDYAG